MTTIVAVKSDVGVVLAGDGRVVAGERIITNNQSKVLRIGQTLYGIAGNTGITSGIIASIESNHSDNTEIPIDVFAAHLATSIRKAIANKETGYPDNDYKYEVIVASYDGLWLLDSDGSCISGRELPFGWDIVATGTGAPVALAAMQTFGEINYADATIDDIVAAAVRGITIASEYDTNTGGMITPLVLPMQD